jgi:octaheme c-type cytochrome (tetrathionate reductase family)
MAMAALAFALAYPVPATAATAAAATVKAPEAPEVKASSSTTDHSKLEALDKDFQTGPEVTKACLACHTEAADQIHKTKHWTWEFVSPETGQRLGKKNIINNFCVAVSSNEPRCTSCHIGYGWKDGNFDFASKENVDCLVCHDTTGSYKKFPTGAGHPNYAAKEWPPKSGKMRPPVDLKKVAQNVGPTSRQTCGACHFYGGGGNAVKHGDIDSSLAMPDKDLDVHMDAEGLDFACSTCHRTDAHAVQGSRYTTVAADTDGMVVPGKGNDKRATCRSCHGDRPMKDEKLNDHTDVVACQTCHIPAFARGGVATKMWWDWSKAGRKINGKPVVKNGKGEVVHHIKKGEFAWAENVVPEYRWFNGEIAYTELGDRVDPENGVEINSFGGSADDGKSRIWPFKVFKGVQPYDAGAEILAVPHLFGKDPDAYWKSYDWNRAISAGMQSVGYSYSGELGFIESEMSWPITHMVASKDGAVDCGGCHAREGRLKGVAGIYMPGRDNLRPVDLAGWVLVSLVLAGVLVHGVVRVFSAIKRS